MLSTPQHSMQAYKSFVKTNNTASIRCPSCALVKNIPVGKFRNSQHTLRTRCKCDTIFLVALDFRRHYRRPTDIEGVFTMIGGTDGGRIKIDNISRSGIGFSLSSPHNITVGQKAFLNFTINDKKRTELTKKVIIRRIHNQSIGCEFANLNQIGKDLGFFLQPQPE